MDQRFGSLVSKEITYLFFGVYLFFRGDRCYYQHRTGEFFAGEYYDESN